MGQWIPLLSYSNHASEQTSELIHVFVVWRQGSFQEVHTEILDLCAAMRGKLLPP